MTTVRIILARISMSKNHKIFGKDNAGNNKSLFLSIQSQP